MLVTLTNIFSDWEGILGDIVEKITKYIQGVVSIERY